MTGTTRHGLTPNAAERAALEALRGTGGNLKDGGMERKLLRKGWLTRHVFDKGCSLTDAGREALEEATDGD